MCYKGVSQIGMKKKVFSCSPCYESVEEYEGYDWKDNVEDGGQPEHVNI